MNDGTRIRDVGGDKARRQAAREMIGLYHEEQLRLLLGRGPEASNSSTWARSTRSTLTTSSTTTSARRGSSGLLRVQRVGGEHAALTLEWMREHGAEEPDWWEAGEPRQRRA